MNNNKRIWYPIKEMGMIAKYISDQLKDAQKQYEVFEKVRDNPGSMNNELVKRMQRV